MDYAQYCILLLLVSLALLVLEVFVPSGGFVGLLMLAALVGSIVCAYHAWWETSRGLWWGYIVAVIFLLPSVLIGAFAIFPRTQFGRRILLDAPTAEEITPYAKEQVELQKLVGKQATAMTLHRPSGLVLVDGSRYHSETRGMMLEAGDAVEIVAVRGNRLVVRLSDDRREPPPAATDESQPKTPKTPEERRSRGGTVDPFLGDNEIA